MRRDYHNWYSSHVNRYMELLTYGHSGLPLLVFPSSMGRFYEYEDQGMIGAIWERIENGDVQVFCVDSFDRESWYNRGLHPHDRVARNVQYEHYILYEVLPLIRQINSSSALCVTGCSFGAYHSLNFALKHPDVVTHCVAMSGAFDMKPFLGGYFDELCYFNSPADYVPNLNDSWFLDRYQQMRLVLAAGDWDICLGENYRMAQMLSKKGIPHSLDVWAGGLKHDWPLWQRMAGKFF